MIFNVIIDLISVWEDATLAYSDTISTKASIDLTKYINKIWTPMIQITDNVKNEGKFWNLKFIDIMLETMTLQKNGTIVYNKRYNLDLRWDFDYFTKRSGHDCKFIFYPMNYNKKYLLLKLGNYTTSGEIKEVGVQLYYSTEEFSGLVLKLSPKRKLNYYLYLILLPSVLFTIMSYLGFWIDSKSVPARAYLGSLAILVNINAYSLIPSVSSINWLGNFLLGCLMFGVFAMIEVGIKLISNFV